MFCRFCGKEIPEGGRFCVNCGKAIEAEDTSRAGAQTDAPQPGGQQAYTSQSGGQQAYTSQPDGQQMYTPPVPPVQVNPAQNYHMAWFKFIIYFQLFANMAIMLYNAVHGFFGIAYGDDAALIYAVCPALKVVDVVYGIICLAFIAGAFFVRQSLAHYKRNAPALYIGFIAVVMVSGLLYTFAGIAALGAVSSYAVEAAMSDVVGSVLGTLIGAAIFIPLNYVYFKKRKELFIN